MIRRLLVGLGGTPFTEVAIQRAVELACAHGAHVTGVTVVDEKELLKIGPVPAGGSVYAQRMRDQRLEVSRERVDASVDRFEEICTRFEAACTRQGISHSVEREAGDPFALMISHARYHDLTIFGLRSLFDYGLTPEPNDALVRLVAGGVRPIVAVSPIYREVRKALIAYNGSMESAKAMRRFVQMRLWPEVDLEIVHFSNSASEAKPLLSAAADYCRAHGYRADTVWIDADARTETLAYAKRSEADIVVMGNSVRSLLMRKLIGDTVLHTIQNADRPLFLSQ
ncbi:MAG: universal stress protein [Desulfobacteraceae bacterium]|nr:universal stress protein [Desulfobacteraceae bacterium]